ncbi:MAG TPA: Hpt domain-containing protein [Pyrinomonadaceae bacterium]|nr:Hpt domain-containing protein [Pyrinomonadaceae bacterium]
MPVSEITNSQNGSMRPSTGALTSDMLDFQVLKAFEKVKSDDGSDIVIELIDLYLESASQGIVTMLNAAAEGDWALLKRTAHTLKGSSGTLGLRQIATICQDLEDASLSPGDDVPALVSLLESKFVEIKPVLIHERDRRRLA